VVKNVAGYDLCKLHVGALGTLGLITQVTLKLRPRAEAAALVTLGCQSGQVGPVLDLLHASRTHPVVLDVLHARGLRPPLAGHLPWVIVVGFEESGDAVKWQISQLIKETSTAPVEGLSVHVERVAGPLWEELRDFPLLPGAVLSFKVNLPPHAVAGFVEHLAGLPESPLLQAQAGNGIIHGHFLGTLTAERAAGILKEMHALAASDGGNVIVYRCPAAWKRTLPVWGLPPSDRWLMRRVKEQLCPRELFNPGRFLV
jgi:glycolate oxidase FAD binding subunit